MSEKRIQVYPDPVALKYLGADVDGEIGPTINKAVEVFADQIARSTVETEKVFTRKEWLFLMDIMNGLFMLPSIDPFTQIILEAEDAQRLNNTGDKWFGEGKGDKAVAALVAKVKKLTAMQAWAVAWTGGYFWSHHEDIDANKDEFWTLKYRTK